jgi:hypothetical protein
MNTQGRISFAAGACLTVLCVFGAAHVAAQPIVGTPNRSVQGVPPAQGASVWGPQDNCVYQFRNGVWYRQDICRVMHGRSIYSTYRPSTGQWLAYYDESQPGWVKSRMLNDANALLIAFPTNGGRVMALVNNQWVDLATWQQSASQAPQNSGNRAADGIAILEIGRQQRAAQERRAAEARKAEEEAYYEKKRLDKYYDDKRFTAEYYKKQQIEKDRLAREANERARANRDLQRSMDAKAAAQREMQRALDAQAAARRKAEQAAAARAAAERRARKQ